MPYALCPMPYAHEYLIFLRKAIHYHTFWTPKTFEHCFFPRNTKLSRFH